MTKEKTITVVAAASQSELELRGADVEQTFDSIKEAKIYATRLRTDEYHCENETATRLEYAQVLVDGKCRYDFFWRASYVRQSKRGQ